MPGALSFRWRRNITRPRWGRPTKLPVIPSRPEVRRFYARMLIDRDAPGDRDKAFRLLTEAVAMYREIGMPKHLEMAETMLGEV